MRLHSLPSEYPHSARRLKQLFMMALYLGWIETALLYRRPLRPRVRDRERGSGRFDGSESLMRIEECYLI
jgi:hypothetical protein